MTSHADALPPPPQFAFLLADSIPHWALPSALDKSSSLLHTNTYLVLPQLITLGQNFQKGKEAITMLFKI